MKDGDQCKATANARPRFSQRLYFLNAEFGRHLSALCVQALDSRIDMVDYPSAYYTSTTGSGNLSLRFFAWLWGGGKEPTGFCGV